MEADAAYLGSAAGSSGAMLTGWSNLAGAGQFNGSGAALGAFKTQNLGPTGGAVASDAWTWYLAAATLGDQTLLYTNEIAATQDDDARYTSALKAGTAQDPCGTTDTRMTTAAGASTATACRAACAGKNAYVKEGSGADRRENLPSPTTTYPEATGTDQCFGYEFLTGTSACKLAHGKVPPDSTPSGAADSACYQRKASNYAVAYVTAYAALYGSNSATYASPGASSLEKKMTAAVTAWTPLAKAKQIAANKLAWATAYDTLIDTSVTALTTLKGQNNTAYITASGLSVPAAA